MNKLYYSLLSCTFFTTALFAQYSNQYFPELWLEQQADTIEVDVSREIIFEFDTYILQPYSDSLLAEIAEFLIFDPSKKMHIYLKEYLPEVYSKHHAKAKCHTIAKSLIAKGVDTKRISFHCETETYAEWEESMHQVILFQFW